MAIDNKIILVQIDTVKSFEDWVPADLIAATQSSCYCDSSERVLV